MSKETSLSSDKNNNKEAKDVNDKIPNEKSTVQANSKENDNDQETQKSVLNNNGLTRKVLKINNELIDEYLLKYPFYHGFLLHEYQLMLLKNYGDFVLRISVRQAGKKGNTKRRTSREPKQSSLENTTTKFNVIIGVFIGKSSQTVIDISKSAYYTETFDESKHKMNILDVPVIVEQDPDGKWVSYYIDKKKKFPSIEEMTAFYRNNVGVYKDKKFSLIKPITLHPWELDKSSVEIGPKLLGEGAFGEVRSGVLRNVNDNKEVPVAIKTLKSEESKGCIKEMMHEARLQLCMRHRNVLRTIGICILKTPLMIVAEYCDHGALREWLQKNKCEVEEKLKFAYGAAKGLEYIHGKHLIHRDLATRNILLSENNVPKIADFGLSRYGSVYKLTGVAKIPIRYLAPETLASFKFSQRTDVYTFGLVIWEIFENGQEPYMKPQPHQEALVTKGSVIKANQLKEIIKKELWIKFNPSTPAVVTQFVSDKIFITDEKKRASMTEVTLFLRGLIKDASNRKETVTTITREQY